MSVCPSVCGCCSQCSVLAGRTGCHVASVSAGEMKIWASDCFFVLVFGGFLQFLSVEAVCDLTELLFWEKKVFYLFDLYQV